MICCGNNHQTSGAAGLTDTLFVSGGLCSVGSGFTRLNMHNYSVEINRDDQLLAEGPKLSAGINDRLVWRSAQSFVLFQLKSPHKCRFYLNVTYSRLPLSRPLWCLIGQPHSHGNSAPLFISAGYYFTGTEEPWGKKAWAICGGTGKMASLITLYFKFHRDREVAQTSIHQLHV